MAQGLCDLAEVLGIFQRVVPDWAAESAQSGLSTGEGLIWAVRDPIYKTEACTYALLDSSAVIRPSHLLAALAFWERVEASIRHIFGDATGDPIADTILRALREQGDMSQTAICSRLFHRNVRAERLSQAQAVLLEAGLAQCYFQETEGRPAVMWRATGT